MGELRKYLKSLFSFSNPTLGVLLPLSLYIYLRLNPALDTELAFPAHHFYIVSYTSIASLIVAVVVGVVGIRQRNLQVIYVSLAFISLAAFFSMHGLSTPGFLIADFTPVVGVAAQLSVLTMSFWLLVSALPTEHPFSAWLSKRARFLLPLWTPAIVILGIIVLRNPSLAELAPVNQEPVKYFFGGMTLLMAGFAGYRYWQSYRYSKFPFQLAIAYVGGWIAVTQIIITTGQTFYASWWVYHFLLLFSVIASVIGLVIQYRRGDSMVRSIVGLFSDDPNERLAAGVSPSVRDLITATEIRDPYTAGHSNRVAQGAFELGQTLNLSPEDLRVLAQGGLVHDIGKLQVPDSILNKPGQLTPEERRQIEKHTVAGYEFCARLGFMPAELAVIRSHHERLDGSGYPDGLKENEIPQLVRILSVVDVWDALTSARAYREAWGREEALDYLMQNRGTQFDPKLVNRWVELQNKKK
jgi:putative nucleotidyltransferase with HDIG domain